ncbi:MAG: RNA methyltransferase [Chloroflexi bacterium]|nr:RNA methyltransferase [Chloroflexota bacterium]MCY3582300.1 RNA methyltransferase [Chloroflexota bacterium]MCY3716164.1 RNA methyltransferase [Chloroflexota bacterium]MDE2650944.1 RNA methyltransferase [Chloroflexota bacterium]
MSGSAPTQARLQKLRRAASQRQPDLTVVIQDVFDPHNLGAIARSCDAFGVQHLHVIFENSSPFDPKTIGKNSSTATNKWLQYHSHFDSEEALRSLKKDGWQVVATVLDAAAEPLYEADFCQPRLAVLLGNERDGLSQRALELADRRVTIPMRGIAQSLNVSVTASLFLYEITRQREAFCPEHLQSSAAQTEQTFEYFLEMHNHLGRRSKQQRKRRAQQRLSRKLG